MTMDTNFESIEYTRDDIIISPAVDKRISRGVDFTLTISALDYKLDDGEYRCIVKKNRGVIRSLKKTLKVKSE